MKYEVTVGAGSLRSAGHHAVRFPHRWTTEGVTVETEFTGAHLLHLSAAGCVLNDVYREASALDLPVHGVRVRAHGDFDPVAWISTGIEYIVDVDTPATASAVDKLLARVDEVAEIPRAIRAGTAVRRTVTG